MNLSCKLSKISFGCVAAILLLFPACSQNASDAAAGTDEKLSTTERIDSNIQAPLVTGDTQFNLAPYTKLPLTASQLEVSSALQPYHGPENLLNTGGESFWHVDVPKIEPRSWILINVNISQPVEVIGILGRQDSTQMWHGHRAVLEGSDDAAGWLILARLGFDSDLPTNEWHYFTLPETKPYRYYRLSVHDWDFLSMARLSLYVPKDALAFPQNTAFPPLQIPGIQTFDLSPYAKISLASTQLEVSSTEGDYTKDNLVQPGTDGFWHIGLPRQEAETWILADMTTPTAVSMVRVLPRQGFTNHLWKGYTANLEVSNDRQNWTTLAELGLNETILDDGWIYFLTGNQEAYRYYRLSIRDIYFLSMARLEFYGFREDIFK